ncbi:carboxylesterase/lipase family protein [Sphingomonas morindae]|uniref:Carboxylic ester hydrolase n=1 Tax=Sphingomonas morindae TaxID=1541170 RepID=A0ABY4X8K6_9SPHN|nr:carboxylesterase family protein [Sphingomonas morindae]USI73262.1 carboxylesterase family protein [Sphingomonas morindae]
MLALIAGLIATPLVAAPEARVREGRLLGTEIAGPRPVNGFFGIPYAAPPVGALRWAAPRTAARWEGVRPAQQFGARCMQQPLFADMLFRSPGASEDCLFLNIWTPADAKPGSRLPVLFYIHGGGAVAGDGSEKRYDGAAMARQDMVVVTINYRLGVFGFLATPELAAETRKGSAGNYGLLDQAAALDWVARNIARFGGDPRRVTIAGESAGSMSVSALIVSPRAKGKFAAAIGESGGVFPPSFHPLPLAAAEAEGSAFAHDLGADTLAALRALPAEGLLAAQGVKKRGAAFIIDGDMLPESPLDAYRAGRAARVPLLLGTNSQENAAAAILGDAAPTLANYRIALASLFGDQADAVAALYPAGSDAEVPAAATALASDRFLAASTWRWFDLHRRTGAPTYYYAYTHVRPAPLPPLPPEQARPLGAVHSAEIEYALGNLDENPVYAWTPEDRAVSRTMQGYFTRFIQTGDPNGPGLPSWARAPKSEGPILRQTIDVTSAATPFAAQARYEAALPLLDQAAPRR